MNENSVSEEPQQTPEGREGPGETHEEPAAGEKPRRPGGRGWWKLLILAAAAAVLGAAVASNWHDRPLSVVLGVVRVKQGLIIIGSAALGFVIGVLFLWSALTKEQ